MRGDAGGDYLRSGAGSDRIEGGAGPDAVSSYGDFTADLVYCGTGYDVVRADSYDGLVGCEKVERF